MPRASTRRRWGTSELPSALALCGKCIYVPVWNAMRLKIHVGKALKMLENWSSLLWNWGAEGDVKGVFLTKRHLEKSYLDVPSHLYSRLMCLRLFTISISLFSFSPQNERDVRKAGRPSSVPGALLPERGGSAVHFGLCLKRTRPCHPGHRRRREALTACILMISLLTQLSSLWAENQTPHSSAKLPRWVYLLLSLNPHFSP